MQDTIKYYFVKCWLVMHLAPHNEQKTRLDTAVYVYILCHTKGVGCVSPLHPHIL